MLSIKFVIYKANVSVDGTNETGGANNWRVCGNLILFLIVLTVVSVFNSTEKDSN